MQHHQLPHPQQTLTERLLLQHQLLNLISPRRRSCWQHHCLATAADLQGKGGNLPIMLHLHIKLSQLLQLLHNQLRLNSLLLQICSWVWTRQLQQLLLQPLQVAL